jgi:hypothetical protein
MAEIMWTSQDVNDVNLNVNDTGHIQYSYKTTSS